MMYTEKYVKEEDMIDAVLGLLHDGHVISLRYEYGRGGEYIYVIEIHGNLDAEKTVVARRNRDI